MAVTMHAKLNSREMCLNFFYPRIFQTHLTTDLVLLCITENDTMANALENEQPRGRQDTQCASTLGTEFEHGQR